MGSMLLHFRRVAIARWMQLGLGAIAILMVLSTLTAYNRTEAFLQLWNFVPFFLLFAILPYVLHQAERLERLALDLLWVSVPINLYALVQYIAKLQAIPRDVRRLPVVQWLRQTPHRERALAVFGHPNTLASFLVVVLALGLGVILQRSLAQRTNSSERGSFSSVPMPVLSAATYFNLIGIFCSGSRNGILVAVLQIVLVNLLLLVILNNRVALWLGLAGLGATAAAIGNIGLGGRSLSWEIFTNDPRIGVWQVAIELIQERPWLGWGLGNFKFLFAERAIGTTDLPMVVHAHNIWLLLWVESGVFVMLGMTLMIGYVYYQGLVTLWCDWQHERRQTGILLGYLLAFGSVSLFALFDVTLYDARVNILNWFLLAAIYANSHAIETEPRSPLTLEPPG